MPATALAALAALAAALLAGCRAHRTIEIRTDPPGARVVLDQEVLGTAPVKVEFWHYGVRRVTASYPGYRTYSRQVEIVPPWYARFPLDILSEVFLPIGWHDDHVVDVVLVAGPDVMTAPDIRSVLDRAEVLRRAGPEGPASLPPVRDTSVGGDPDGGP
jgi:hypothetical protein